MDGDDYFDIDNPCSETDCNDNDPAINPGAGETCDDDLSTAELLIGTWTSSEIIVNTSVGTQSLTDYLIDVVGLSPEDAAAQVALYEADLEQQVTGTLIINSDNTYESFFDGGTDSGTWSLSSDEKTLTLFEGADVIIITINSISASTWNGSTSDVFLQDLDGDPATPDVAVMAEASVIFIR